ncbi:transcriptional regulator [Halobiforma lacisalsi AJ5]|uniref:Regulatory protein ArsR n=1 Tax=Natronobacterium lacisalsi AJ5 TaxID=358396 RepID=M0LVD7_NATLA|nr:helix-turn-helix domain-containing protein [Halobiforma lacisalsi]APW97735.1 transcriptional regulator [Halobiforma lacisalsi AJ5]EMA37522.1 regulatory protein ArsR [Halobiforma lacisalsi AJ5]
MARLFPFRSETSPQEGAPRVVDLEGEDADAVFSALSSTTAREIYSQLDDQPGTPSDVADAIDSSIQNVRYHLENLEEAGLVEVVDTWYSSRGNEMSVYATTDGPLIVTSDESKASQLKSAISRLIGGIGALAGGSLLVQYGLSNWLMPGQRARPEGGAGGDAAAVDDQASGDESADRWNGEADADAEADADGEAGTDDAGDDVGITSQEDGADETEDAEATGDSGDMDAADAPDADADAGGDPDVYADDPGAYNVDDPGVYDVDAVADGGADAIFNTIPPGALFFLGGLVVLLAVTCYWYWYRYRPMH